MGNDLAEIPKWDEARFGLDMTSTSYDCRGGFFNMGAMENKGLIFNSKYVLARPIPRRIRYLDIERVMNASISTTGPATASPAATGSS